MTVTAKALLDGKQIEASQTTQYTADDVTAKITKFTVTNTSSASADFSCNLVPNGGSASDTNLLVDARTISAGETYICPELVGHVLEDGDFISTLASSASALTVRISGFEIS